MKKTSQFLSSQLSSVSEYALILGTGAGAAVSLAAQQVTAASLPLTALVAIGLLNRHRLDRQLKDHVPGDPDSEETSMQSVPVVRQEVVAKPTLEPAAARSYRAAFTKRVPPTRSSSQTQFSKRHGQLADELADLQQEKLYTIGAYLQQVRQSQGLALQDIHSRTFIQMYMLNAIEMGALHRLPEPFYVRAFISKYAQALGLNGREIAAEFPVER